MQSQNEHDRPAQVGMWEPVAHTFKFLPVHVALLPTGKVLAFGGSGNDERREGHPYPAEVWDPETGESRTIDQPLDGDLFCAGQCFLPDGRLLVAGGTYRYDRRYFGLPVPFSGLEQAYTFDPWSEAWTRVPDMANGRWYPTLVSLEDGRILAMAGFTKRFPWAFRKDIELYARNGGWRRLRRAARWLPLYPRLHLVPGGVFYSGSYNTHYVFPFKLKGFPTALLDPDTYRWTTIGPPNRSQREEGASILLPLLPPKYSARVLLVGGGTPRGKLATAEAEIIELSQDRPRWRQVSSMAHARYYLYSVMLPDKRVLVIGGRSGETGHHHPSPSETPSSATTRNAVHHLVPQDRLAIHVAEAFNPDREEWSTLPPMTLDRLYHSNALLLPDGRVMVAGSNPDRRVNELRIEIYRPAYLFARTRPTIEAAPRTVRRGEPFEIVTQQASELTDVALLRPSATTHGLDTDQRYVGLSFRSTSSTTVEARLPPEPGIAPPGYYMLFVLSEGVPSHGLFLSVE